MEIKMANTPQSKKRAIQSEKHRQRNASLRSLYRTHIRKVLVAIKAGIQEAAMVVYKETLPIIDKMVTKGIIHKNKAARHKSRLSGHIKKLGESKKA